MAFGLLASTGKGKSLWLSISSPEPEQGHQTQVQTQPSEPLSGKLRAGVIPVWFCTREMLMHRRIPEGQDHRKHL